MLYRKFELIPIKIGFLKKFKVASKSRELTIGYYIVQGISITLPFMVYYEGDIHPYSKFCPAVISFFLLVEVFSRLCRQHLPQLHEHLIQIQILTMLSVNWFLTLYITVLNHNDVIGIIDCFFINGSKVQQPNHTFYLHVFPCLEGKF